MTKALYNSVVPNTCGVGVLGIFRENFEDIYEDGWNLDSIKPVTGCGWIIVGFTPKKKAYEDAYKKLCKKYKLIYQSPVRKNTRTQNQFFFCIFDTK